MKTKTKKTKINWELLAEQAYNVGRITARKTYCKAVWKGEECPCGFGGYERLWDDIPQASKVGYVAFAQFVEKAVKDLRG